jgi:energy-coupling factor transporter transmembrane protein EcfT
LNIGIFILIVIILVALYYFFSKNDATDNTISEIKKDTAKVYSDNIGSISLHNDYLIDNNGRKYKLLNLTREIPRRTYILGDLTGKYWGEIDQESETEYFQEKFFDFNIYEITVSNSKTQKDVPFEIENASDFPRERLPELLAIRLVDNGKEYELNLHEPKFGIVNFDRKLHQIEGSEVFGTINTQVTGYVLDFITEEYKEIYYLPEYKSGGTPPPPPPDKHTCITRTNNPTGKVERKENYYRNEYWCSCNVTKYWGEWIYSKPVDTSFKEGCSSSLLGLLGLIIGIVFFIFLLPHLVFLIPIFAFFLLLNFIPSTIWNWIFRSIAGILLFCFIASIIYFLTNSDSNYIPKPDVVDNEEEKLDTLIKILKNDTLISHFRSWRDYDNNLYEGSYFVKLSSYQNAKSFKKNLQIIGNSPDEYDKILFSLKENDKSQINGLYQLFDSLKIKNQLGSILFAKMVVSFVQDIPYTLVLTENCDPNLYSDNFIKEYLSSNGAKCDGYQKFGINTPVEFLASLKGDCDTRTLLLYTILSHYNYDIALFSSEVYGHSIIGINLPMEGLSYNFQNRKYILWETTAPNMKPGILPTEISNTNNWRISLKSK